MENESLTLADTKNRLSEIINDVEHRHASYTITKHGKPAAVLMSYEELLSLYETLDILSDDETMKRLAEADAEPRSNHKALSKDEALALVIREAE